MTSQKLCRSRLLIHKQFNSLAHHVVLYPFKGINLLPFQM